jgi:hypothetical protein
VLHRILVMESRKNDLQQVLANLADGALRRHVVGVAVVQPAGPLVGAEQFRHRFVHQFRHPDRVPTRRRRDSVLFKQWGGHVILFQGSLASSSPMPQKSVMPAKTNPAPTKRRQPKNRDSQTSRATRQSTRANRPRCAPAVRG